MNTDGIITEIDRQIAQLQQARALLSGVETTAKRKPGRPAKVTAATQPPATSVPTPTSKPKKARKLSADGRARISAALKARWAKKRATKK